MAGFGYDPQDRPVAGWVESSANGGVNNFTWSRRENGIWNARTMNQPGGGIRAAQADFVLREDGTPFFAYAIRDAFIFGQDWYTAHIVNLALEPNGHGPSVQPIEAGQSCIAAYPKFAMDFAPNASAPSFLLGTHCSFSGWLSLDNATIHGEPAFRATAGTGGEFHSLDYATGPTGSHHVTYYAERGGPNWGAYYSNGSPGHEILLVKPHRNRAAETSIAVGPDGRIHVAIGGVPLCANTFEGGLLYLTSTDGVNWTREFVDEVSGRSPSINLDAAGNPHIAYWRNNTQVMLASFNAGAWQSTPIYSASASVGRASVKLAFDAADDPHVLFFNPDTNDISVSSGLSSNAPPVATNPNTQTSPAGEIISLQIVANDPESDVLSYSSCNLPPGLSINSSSGLISGTIPAETAPGSYDVTVTVSDTGGNAASLSFRWVITGAAMKLAVVVQPTNAAALATITPAVQVAVQDVAGNTITAATNAVTIAIGNNAGGNGVLSGTLTRNAVNGIATFDDLSLNRTGTGYTLSSSSAGLTSATSNAFDITVGAAAKLAFFVQPTNAVSSVTISPAIQVNVQDAAGNTVTDATTAVMIAIGNNAGGSGVLAGTQTRNAISGIATFDDLSLDRSGNGYTLAASSTGLASAASNTFDITPGVAAKLVFIAQPTNTGALSTISPAVKVAVQDAAGNTITDAANPVTIDIGNNAGGSGVLSGTLTRNAINGIAAFDDLSLNRTGTGYTLSSSAAGLTSATSNAFDIRPGAAAKLTFIVQPANTTALATISPAVQVEVQDAAGNTVTEATNAVTIALENNASGNGILSGTLTRNAVTGTVSFDDLSLDQPGDGYRLRVTGTNLTQASSGLFNITRPTFVVTKTVDTNDGACNADCSLREAITAANIINGADVINFNISGISPFTITLGSVLPDVSSPITIDATTQAGFAGSPIVGVRGSGISQPNLHGFRLTGGNSVIRGLQLGALANGLAAAIVIESSGNAIKGNYIGVSHDGSTRSLNQDGIRIVSGSNNIIGGSSLAERNLISGNNRYGIHIASNNNQVVGNYVGTNAAGTAALANERGVVVAGSNNTVGGLTTAERNVISGNNFSGVELVGGTGNAIQGNYVGRNADNTGNLGSSLGIAIHASPNNIVGGTLPGAGNTISGHQTGIRVTNSQAIGNLIRGNSIFGSSQLGISLGGSTTPTPNDPGDSDVFANNLQNYPVLTSANLIGGSLVVHGTLNSKADTAFTLEFFSNQSCNSSGNGEGETPLGTISINTDGSGIAGFTASLPSVADGVFITGTATDSSNNTSEFSQCRQAKQIFSLSGRLTDAGNAPLADTLVKLTGLQSAHSLTDANGDYSFADLPTGNYTVTPDSPNYSFAPASLSYSNPTGSLPGQDFVGTRSRYGVTVVVRINSEGQSLPLGQVTVNVSGTASQTGQSDANGQALFYIPSTGNFVLTPNFGDYTFSPTSITLPDPLTSDHTVEFIAQAPSGLNGRLVGRINDFVVTLNPDGSGMTQTNLVNGLLDVDVSADLSRDGAHIGYLHNHRIYSSNYDGSNPTQLAGLGSFSRFGLRWSPDKSKLAFAETLSAPHTRISMRDNVSGTIIPLTSPDSGVAFSKDRGASWSPDGTRIVFSRFYGTNQSNSHIFSINADGTNLTQLTSGPFPAVFDTDPDWSPDGTRIVFARDNKIVLMNADGSNQSSFTPQSAVDVSNPRWSPDGQKLLFIKTTSNDYPMHPTIVISNPDGTAQTPIHDALLSIYSMSWGGELQVATSAGSNVAIESGAVSLNFAGVSGSGGNTVVSLIPPNSAGTMPGGFVIAGLAYEISTTAAYTSPVTVCVGVPSHIQFNSSFSLMHNENGVLVDRTTTRNFQIRQICGTVTSLSPFALAEQIDPAKPQIFGLVVDSNGNPMSGVRMLLTGAENKETETDTDGTFKFVNLTAGANYNVQPEQLGYMFSSYSQDFVNLSGEQPVVFTGTASSFPISGRVTDQQGNGVDGALIQVEGSTQATTDANGNYTLNDLPAAGSYTLRATNGGNNFSPSETTISPLVGSVTDVDFIQLSPVTPTAADASVSGRVLDDKGAPVAGVLISMSGTQDRKTISDSDGNYRFDNVETNGFYTVTPSRAHYQFSPANWSFSLLANVTDAAFTAIPDAVIVGNLIDSPEYFVRQHYLDFLGREPDESGFNFWNNQMLECGDDAACQERRRINVSAAYFLSIEFQETGGLVDSVYRASYGRRPLYAEFMPDMASVAESVVVGSGNWRQQLAENKRAFCQSFVTRAAFQQEFASLSNDAFVDKLIGNTHVGFSQGERDALITSLNSGTATRADVLLRITENEAFEQAKRNEAFVMMEYFGYLRRDPDESGYQYWLNKLNQFDGNFERAEMVKAFINSSEYRQRFR
jgi:CSLREA domain-containing protein